MQKLKRLADRFRNSAVNRWTRAIVAVLAIVLAIIAVGVLGELKDTIDHGRLVLLQLAVIFAGGASFLFLVIVALQDSTDYFVAPTAKQIRGDLAASVWSLPFSLPLVFAALDGYLTPVDTWLVALLLILASVVFPAVRPRWTGPRRGRRHRGAPGPFPASPTTSSTN